MVIGHFSSEKRNPSSTLPSGRCSELEEGSFSLNIWNGSYMVALSAAGTGQPVRLRRNVRTAILAGKIAFVI